MHLLYATDRQVDAYLVKALREAGHVVDPTTHPADGVEMAAGGDYQAIILDWSAPSVDCARRFAAVARDALLLVIAAAGDETRRSQVLKAGADACFLRPIAFMELEARLEALARLVSRVRPAADHAAIELVVAERTVRLQGRSSALSRREFHLMEYLLAHEGEVISLERLQQQVWGDASDPKPELVRACLSRLRRKLETLGAEASLRAVTGHGYLFQTAASAE